MSRPASGNTNQTKSSNAKKQDKQKTNGNKQNNNNQNEESSSSDDENEPIRVPIQLKVEFVNAIMFRRWAVAKKLCHFMLMYEPDNNEAKQYAPLIDYMLAKEESQSSSDEEDDDETSDNDSSDNNTNSSDSSSDEEQKQIDITDVQTPKPTNASLSNKCIQHK